MFFKKKKPNRLYVPAKAKWYKPARRAPAAKGTRKLFSLGLKSQFSRLFKDVFLYVLGLGVILGTVAFFLFSNKFSINKIEVARNDVYIDNAAIAKLLDPYKGHSIFTFSSAKAQQLIHKNYPEFSHIEIRKLLPDRIKVDLKTYELMANLKAYYILPEVDETEAFVEDKEDSFDKQFGSKTISKKQLTPIEQKAVLNRIGQALFDRDPNPSLMTIRIEGLTQPIEDRELIFPKEDLQYLQESIKYLTNLLQMEVKEVRYLPIAHEIHLTTSKNLTLWLLTKKPYKEQLDRFNKIYKAAKLDQQSIAYIDLRASKKVIYCPKGAACDK